MPKAKPMDSDGFFYGFKESIEYVKRVLLEQVLCLFEITLLFIYLLLTMMDT